MDANPSAILPAEDHRDLELHRSRLAAIEPNDRFLGPHQIGDIADDLSTQRRERRPALGQACSGADQSRANLLPPFRRKAKPAMQGDALVVSPVLEFRMAVEKPLIVLLVKTNELLELGGGGGLHD